MYDVVVVGGSAAGLNAALVLTRARRRVLVVDSGQPRNAVAEHVHGFLSRDGIPPTELLAAGRAEVSSYGGELRDGTVAAVEPGLGGRPTDGERGFGVRLGDGEVVAARRVLVATGLADEFPAVDGLAERWGRDVVQCPYCHGYELRDQPIGLLAGEFPGPGPTPAQLAMALTQWSRDVVLFENSTTIAADDRVLLGLAGVRVVEGKVIRLVSSDDRLRGVEVDDGRVIRRSALFVWPRSTPRDEMLAGLGCERLNGFLVVDEFGQTSVPGVWAAGNVVDPRAKVITAASAGVVAAMAINADLTQEDVMRAVQAAQ